MEPPTGTEQSQGATRVLLMVMEPPRAMVGCFLPVLTKILIVCEITEQLAILPSIAQHNLLQDKLKTSELDECPGEQVQSKF